MPSLNSHIKDNADLQALYGSCKYQNIIQIPSKDFWVFGYGSLIWNPGFSYKRAERAMVFGYHRQFCVASKVYRGTPENPGLVLGLRPGGSVTGRAFLVDRKDAAETLKYLECRELRFEAYDAKWIRTALYTNQCAQNVKALSFVIPKTPGNKTPLSETEIVRRLATCSGKAGSNREYLDNLCNDLRHAGMNLGTLEKIQKKVSSYVKENQLVSL